MSEWFAMPWSLSSLPSAFRAGGWLMVPIGLCSIIALAIVLERFWALRRRAIVPRDLARELERLHHEQSLDAPRIAALCAGSALGRMLAAGLNERQRSRAAMKARIEEAGRQAVAEMERHLDTLGTIASVAPLLGLLGTVLGMIEVFAALVEAGTGDPALLAGGIAKALITTAAGLTVAIPALLFHRYFHSRIQTLVIGMEEQSLRLLDALEQTEPPP